MSSLREYFIFSRRERNGTAVLAALIIVLVMVRSWIEHHPVLPKADFAGFDQLLASWKKEEAPAGRKYFARDSSGDRDPFPAMKDVARQKSMYEQKELFVFNPNGLPAEDWMRLGLTKAQAQAVKNYEQKGGSFRSKEDVKKLFVVSPELYSSWEAFIVIPSADALPAGALPKTNPAKNTIVELNVADSSTLVSLNGIGPAFAKRILAYRQRLGGFRSKEQLLEVFGLDQSRYEQIEISVKADSSLVRKISINSSGTDDLRKHPYITYNTANAIVNYRKQHGNFASIADLRKVDLVSAELYRKLAAYLSL